MSDRITIRKSTDYDLVRQLHEDIFPLDEMVNIVEGKTHCWIVWLNGDAVGFCAMDLLSSNIAYFSRAGLSYKVRGKGLQKRLISVRERFAKKQGYAKIITYTVLDNIKSSVNLQKRGYFLYEPEYKYQGSDVLYWLKEIK